MDTYRFCNSGFQLWILLSIYLYVLIFAASVVSGQHFHNECVLSQSSLHRTDWSGMIHGQPNGTKGCVWNVTVPPGNSIKVKLTLQLIDGFIPNSDCTRHGVKVNGGNVTKYFCLTSNMTSWTVPSNEVAISVVSTDMLHRGNVFYLSYEAVCGGMQDLDSTFVPELPPGTGDCTWTIRHNKGGRKAALYIGNIKDWVFDIKTKNGTLHPDVTNRWIYLDSNTINITVHRRNISPSTNHSSAVSGNNTPLELTVQSLGADNPCPDVCGSYGYCEPKGLDGAYYCNCSKGYKGKNCTDIAYDGPYCDETDDDVIGDNIHVHWTITEVNETDYKSCPQDRMGFASRPCIPDGEGGAIWGRPDLTGCVSKHIKDIENMANQLKQNTVVNKTEIINVTSRIVHATSSQGDGPASALYPGDLVVSTDVVKTIADVSKQSRDHHNDLEEIAQGYGEAVSGLVDNKIVHIWKLIDLTFVEERMASILTSMTTLAGNIANVRMLSEHRRKREMSNQSQSLSINSSTDNIDFSITFHERIAMCDSASSFTMGGNSSSSITFPSTVFRNAVKASQDRYIQLYTARFSSITDILTSSQREQEKQIHQENEKVPGKFVNSDIVSGSVLNIPEDALDNLDKPIILFIEIKNISLLASFKEKCVFMNLSDSNHERRWSSQGCREDKISSNKTHIVCLCNHLTNFAVLMDVFEVSEKIDDDNNAVLTYISYGGGGLSVLCCIISVIVFEYYRIRNDRIRTHEQLAITIIFVQVLFIGGIDRTENQYVCMSIAIALHYFLTAMFCWMLLEGFHLYVLLVKVFKRGRNFGKYLLAGWGVPVVVVGISAGVFHDKYGNDKVCWLSHDMLLVVFIPAVGLVIMINTVVLLMVLRIMMKSMPTRANSEDRSAIRAGLKAAVVLLPLLGLTWTLGFLTVENKEALVFTYLFTIFNSFQGVFFFVLHCLLSVDVQKAYKRESRKKNSISWTNFTGKTRKSSDRDTFYSNSKESVNTLVTDASSLDRRTRPQAKPLANGVDRIYRDARQIDSHHYSSNILYHDQLYRSKSDETAKTTAVRHQQQHSISFDDQTGLRFYRGQYSLKTPPKRNSVIYQDIETQTTESQGLENSPTVNVEELYSKPVKRTERQHTSSESKSQDNHVTFKGSESTEEDEVFHPDPIRTTPRRKDPIVNTVSSEDFLKELKQRTASFRDN